MIVIFEGPDGGGKDTVRRAFEKNNGFEHVCTTRLFFSDIVYADYYDRPLFSDVGAFKKFIDGIKLFMEKFNVLIVYVTANKDVIYNRIKDRGERIDNQPNLTSVEALFKLYLKQWAPKGRVCTIDTSVNPLYESVQIIEDVLSKIQKRRLVK